MKKIYNIHTILILLILLTISTYMFGHFNSSGLLVVLFLIISAFIKGLLIMREFMELRGVSLLWRVIMYGWLTTVCSTIVIAYTIGGN
ncbi:MAG: cytochrome C oxidase subunit IV family protein [Alcanivoracaceae bacterium]|nr:cytochrome C oxidase subunit IV family protein [Alcanivoracaceae bacterium]